MSHVIDILELIAFFVFYGAICWFVGLAGMVNLKAFIRGWLSEDAGRQQHENPHRSDTTAWHAWDKGWKRSRETNP